MNLEIITDKIESLLPSKKVDIFGKDQLMNNVSPYYLLASFMFIAIWLGL